MQVAMMCATCSSVTSSRLRSDCGSTLETGGCARERSRVEALDSTVASESLQPCALHVSGSSMWEQSLQGLIKALRASPNDEVRVVRTALDEIGVEIKSADWEVKAAAVLKLTYVRCGRRASG